MSRIAAAARGWIGTPFAHGASVRGVAADCLGLLRGVWREVIGPEPVPIPVYAGVWNRGDEGLLDGVEAVFPPVTTDAAMRAGQIVLFAMCEDGVAQHVGILTGDDAAPRFVHAYSGRGVVESWLSDPWRRRIVARFGWPMEG